MFIYKIIKLKRLVWDDCLECSLLIIKASIPNLKTLYAQEDVGDFLKNQWTPNGAKNGHITNDDLNQWLLMQGIAWRIQ